MINEQIVGINQDHLCPVLTGHFLTQKTKQAFLEMQSAAKQDGIDLAIASSFRSFERQAHIWNRKFTGLAPVLDQNAHPIANWDAISPDNKVLSILRWSALPGASRHHWGTDLDVYSPSAIPPEYQLQLTPAEYDEQIGMFANLTKWLSANMFKYGFYRPYAIDLGGTAPEAWHISFAPEAARCTKLLTLDMLNELLHKNPIEGYLTVCDQLPLIWERFIMNVCKEPEL